MAEKFYTIITDIGKAKIANCISQATKVDFVKMKVGDGGGKYYNPVETQTDLINTVWEGDIGHVVVDEENPNWINIEVILPADVGGFMIREYGVFDSENNLLAIAKCAETYKPVAAEGSTKELNMKMILAISNIDSVTLKIDPALMYAKKKDLDIISNKVNELEDKLNKHIDDSLYQEAGGTATAITLSMLTLKNGYSKTFIATANNNGSATTINGKPLYKPGTTTGPNIKEGKAYTVWYNSVSDCFFLQASAEGDATVAQVLAGAIFSTDDDTGLVGIMPNNGSLNKVLSLNETFNLPAGYYSGGRVTQNIPNNGAMNANLNCGQSKDIPAGYTNGGRITANSLASQTPANADASTIIAGRNAWVNGNLINGNASVQSLGGKKFSTGSFGEIASNATVTASFGFRPSAIVGYSGSWAVLSFIVGSTAGGGLYSVRTAAVCATISLKDDGFLLYNTGKGGIIPGLTWCAYE
ncbi:MULTISPECIES: phage tail protein [Clostridium]|uniref:Phage tail fiber protein n=1 Tax=Clostridium carnis TaxID=1530 RepID=A0ABY6T1K7_9CLOT|nr:phage tail protein [Clostridium carnis]CAI3559770.1 putative phage tail fiber protein [Clostridium neonatale]CAI3561214.1 putative phage tail fiber protein [Clostridium neonatale]CAI3582081.1 putative phage tail fiber protein [Clostridium neonatale]CAI3621848.1 putative phage tail fiber protein [Clostridium neonatale]CAI3676153.1 putative phage tail fiber protein [Clostridium neonatale]